MANGQTAEGWKLDTPEFRELFTRESVLASDWYAARLDAKRDLDVAHQQRGLDRLREFSSAEGNYRVAHRMNLDVRIAEAEAELARMTAADYRDSLVGTIGRQAQFG